MDIIRPQLDQVRIEKDGRLPFTLIDAITRIYGYLAAATNANSTNAVVIQDTHANRNILYPAANEVIGSFYFETDRKVEYVARLVSSAHAWVYFAGVMSGLIAARPADLGTNDAGFLYTSTDSLDYRWSGTAWVTLGTVRGGAAMVNAGALTKVSAAGTIGESAVTDDGTSVILTTRDLLLDNGKRIRQKDTGGAYQNLLTHFTDDIVYLDNASGDIKIRPKAGSTLFSTENFDVTGNSNVSGVYKKAGTAGITGVAALAPLTAIGLPGTLTFTGGIITAYVAPT